MAPGDQSRIRGLMQVAYTVSNLDRSVRFFRDTLGIPFLFSAPPGLAFLDLDGVRLMLSEAKREAGSVAEQNSTLYLRCPSIESSCAALSSRGVEIADEPHVVARVGESEVWIAFIRDPDGTLVGLMEEVPASAP